MKKYLKSLKDFIVNLFWDFLNLFGVKRQINTNCNPYEEHLKIKDKGGIIINGTELYSIIRNKLKDKFKPNTYLYLIDSNYYLPSKEYVKEVLDVDKTDTRKYRAQTYDCDDFAFILNSTFIELTYKDEVRRAPFSFGVTMGELPMHHAINIFVDDQKEVYFVEPQSDAIINYNSDNIKVIYSIII